MDSAEKLAGRLDRLERLWAKRESLARSLALRFFWRTRMKARVVERGNDYVVTLSRRQMENLLVLLERTR